MDCAEHVTPWASERIELDERGWNQETREFYLTYLSETSKRTWGLFEPDYVFGLSEQVHYYEQEIGYHFPVILCYSHFYEDPRKGKYKP